MPYALKWDADTWLVEATFENLGRLGGLDVAITSGPSSFVIGGKAGETLRFVNRAFSDGRDFVGDEVFGRLAPREGWDGGSIDQCRGCPQMMDCVAKGGPSAIFGNHFLWEGCSILKDDCVVLKKGGTAYVPDALRKHEMDSPVMPPSWVPDHKVRAHLVNRGFTLTDKKMHFYEPEDWEIQCADDYERYGKVFDDDFTDRWLQEKSDGPQHPQHVDWSGAGRRAYKAYCSARSKASAPKVSAVAKFRREECKHCVYECKPLSHWTVSQITDNPVRLREHINWDKDDEVASPLVPTVLTGRKCALTIREAEAEFDGSESQIDAMICSLMAGLKYEGEERGWRDVITYGQEWRASGAGWKNHAALATRNLRPPYQWGHTYHVLEACEEFGFDYDELRAQIEGLGDKMPLTFWALKRLGLICLGGQANLKSTNKTYARNDVLSIELNIGTLARPYIEPEIRIGSDNLSSNWGGFMNRMQLSDGNERIPPSERPRFETIYTYPFFEGIQRQTGMTPGSGRR